MTVGLQGWNQHKKLAVVRYKTSKGEGADES